MTVEAPTTPRVRRVTREELHQMVWQTPMVRLAKEFGISGNGLAKVCDKLDVPYPPRGYWAKKEAGKPVIAFKLPPRKDSIPNAADIHPTPPKPPRLPKAQQSAAAAAERLGDIVVPSNLDDLHPRVRAWIADHEKNKRNASRKTGCDVVMRDGRGH
ncbi:hypothetical protein ACFFWD_16535 [Bradyrhizobium erythrophlei]|uniref:hypothetical protein n=1 Tax=Bradyrhizobium erythrophlei TaxID=1437360 RepID=UPI0035E7E479